MADQKDAGANSNFQKRVWAAIVVFIGYTVLYPENNLITPWIQKKLNYTLRH